MEVSLYSHIYPASGEEYALILSMLLATEDAPVFETDLTSRELKKMFAILENIPLADSAIRTEMRYKSMTLELLVAQWNFNSDGLDEVIECLENLENCTSFHYIETDEGYLGAATLVDGRYTDYKKIKNKDVQDWDDVDELLIELKMHK